MLTAVIEGVRPWLPRPLAHYAWWTKSVPAERLAALRIAVAAVLLIDILGLYLLDLCVFFGRDSLGDTGSSGSYPWAMIDRAMDQTTVFWIASAWLAATIGLLIGWRSRLCAAGAWAGSMFFLTMNPRVHNAGDSVRTIILFYLMLSPCGAVWSRDRRRRKDSTEVQVFIHPWPLRLLLIQLAVIYFFNGFYKLMGPMWRSGEAMHYVLADLSLTRISLAQLPVSEPVLRFLTWSVLIFEIGFPMLIMCPLTRTPTLVFGVLMHLGIGASMELGVFALYMLCMYVPLAPWERWLKRLRAADCVATSPGLRAATS